MRYSRELLDFLLNSPSQELASEVRLSDPRSILLHSMLPLYGLMSVKISVIFCGTGSGFSAVLSLRITGL
jgi:hypothetical protein